MQPTLEVGRPDDPLEAAADRAAEQVMRASVPAPTEPGASEVARERLQASAVGTAVPKVTPRGQAGIYALHGGGRALPAGEQRFFGARFGHDFGYVRVHADGRAAGLASEVGARAFTVGRHVVFGAGEYRPETAAGRRLLAHELAHTIQQGHAPRRAHRSPVMINGHASARVQRKTLVEERAAGCGICYPSARLAGMVAHKEIQFAWMLPYMLGKAGKAARTAEEGIRCGRRLRPDIVLHPSPHVWVIGSIKPARQRWYDKGKYDFIRYRDCIRAYDGDAKVVPLRIPGIDKGLLPFPNWQAPETCEGQKLRLNPPDEWGVYGYYCSPKRSTIKQRNPKCRCGPRKKKEKQRKPRTVDPETQAPKIPVPGIDGPWTQVPRLRTPKTKLPKIKVTTPKLKPAAGSAGAFNLGIGLSLLGTNVGAANAGVGVSLLSKGATVETVGAGVVYNSQGVAVGSVGAGSSTNSMGATAGTASAGTVDESKGAAAGVAVAGSAERTEGTATGVVGSGSAKDVKGDASGVSGTVDAATKGTGDPTGSETTEGPEGGGMKDPSSPGKGTEATEGGTAEKKGGGEKGAGSGMGQAKEGGGTTGTGSGVIQTLDRAGGDDAAFPNLQAILSTPAGKEVLAEATQVSKQLEGATPLQRELLKAIVVTNPGGVLLVPSTTWMETFLAATADLDAAAVEKLKVPGWLPTEKLTPQELRKRIDAVLKAPENALWSADALPKPRTGKSGDVDEKQAGKGGQDGMGTAKEPVETGQGKGTSSTQKPDNDQGVIGQRGLKPDEKVGGATQTATIKSVDRRVKNGHTFKVGDTATIKVRYYVLDFGVYDATLPVKVVDTDPLTFEHTETVVLEKKEGELVVGLRQLVKGGKFSFSKYGPAKK
ncbi:MAG TPA: DUF4157 domain-containing protein [Longimicrobium sp.]|nr:DUF4157 domain-containing protein [Longimicrobium sp.]